MKKCKDCSAPGQYHGYCKDCYDDIWGFLDGVDGKDFEDYYQIYFGDNDPRQYTDSHSF